jgi:hypothetical protein
VKKRLLMSFLFFSSLAFPRLVNPHESQRTLLLEVIRTTYDVSRTETLVYVRVFSDGSAEAHPVREVDFRRLALKTASIPPNELATLSEFLNSSKMQRLDAKYERYWGNIDFGQKWQITIAQGGSQKSMVLENFQPFLARAKKEPYPADLERLARMPCLGLANESDRRTTRTELWSWPPKIGLLSPSICDSDGVPEGSAATGEVK